MRGCTGVRYKLPLGIVEDIYKCDNKRYIINEKSIRTNDDRYENFAINGTKCICCGLEGEYAILEYSYGYGWHVNIYGIRDDKEIQLTKDHIYPKSKGGLDSIVNYQVMCETCNCKKKDIAPMPLRFALERGYTTKRAIVDSIHKGKKNVLRGV